MLSAAPPRRCSLRLRRAQHAPLRAEPFAPPPPPPAPPPAAPPGFLAPSEDRATVLSLPASQADALLRRFDAASLAAQRARLPAAPPPPPDCTPRALRAAAVSLAARSGAVMLGLCCDDDSSAVAALKSWTAGLGLPRGMLHGLDAGGVRITLNGPVFVKYNSSTGDATVSGYDGDARGVLFTPSLPDGVFRQYGYLPATLFE